MQTITLPRQKPPHISRVRSAPQPVATIAGDYDMAPAVARLQMSICHAGYQAIEAVLSDPRRQSCAVGVADAIRYGLTVDLLPTSDQRIIYRAILDTAPHYRLAVVLPYARYLLREAQRWQDDLPAFWRGPMWSDASLVSLSDQWPGSAAVPMLVHRLIELTTTLEKITIHYSYANHLLRGVE